MNSLSAKEYLKQIRKCDLIIENKLSEVQSLHDLALSVTTGLKSDVVKTSGAGDKLGDTVSKIVDLQNEINAEIDRFVDLKREVMLVIDQLEDAALIDLLYKRYFQYKKWEEIAIEMNYSFRQILRMHGQALTEINHVLQCHIDK